MIRRITKKSTINIPSKGKYQNLCEKQRFVHTTPDLTENKELIAVKVADAMNILFKSVYDRKIRQILDELIT